MNCLPDFHTKPVDFDFEFGDMDRDMSLETNLTTDESIIQQLSNEIQAQQTIQNDTLGLGSDPLSMLSNFDIIQSGVKSERSSPVSSPDSAFDSNSGDDWSSSDSPIALQDLKQFEMLVEDPAMDFLVNPANMPLPDQFFNLSSNDFDPLPVLQNDFASVENNIIEKQSCLPKPSNIMPKTSFAITQQPNFGINPCAKKPSDIKVINKTINNKSGSSKIILTAEEFNKLTSQGLIKIKSQPDVKTNVIATAVSSGGQVSVPQVTQQTVTQTLTSPFVTTVNAVNVVNGNHVTIKKPVPSLARRISTTVDEKALKKHQRMIKNRESACLSRKKKKEHVTNLENIVQKLTEENSRLSAENYSLRCRVTELETENKNLRTISRYPKSSTCVLAVFFIVCLNFNFFSQKVDPHKNIDPLSIKFKSRPSGRSLLSINQPSFNDNISTNDVEDLIGSMHKNSSSNTDCPLPVNSTESQRHYSVITSWLKENSQLDLKNPLNIPKYKYSNWPFLDHAAFKKRTNTSIFLPNLNNMKWALAFNRSSQANSQFSFIMTAALTEGDFPGLPDDFTKMIQIDCVITNTKTFHKSIKSNNATFTKAAKVRRREILRKKRSSSS